MPGKQWMKTRSAACAHSTILPFATCRFFLNSLGLTFMVQGAASGVIGTLAGVLLGLGIAFNIDVIVPAIERALSVSFLPSSVYLISRMPSEPRSDDIVPIVVISLLLSFVATLYPSWRASRVQPAEALRYE